MIAFVGDIHGEFWVLNKILNKLPSDVPVIQVGDFGYWPRFSPAWAMAKAKRQVMFIDGNHDDVRELLKYDAPTEVWDNAMYIPRGTVVHIAGKKVLFLGGATSVDRHHREKGADFKKAPINAWFAEEDITLQDTKKALDNAAEVGGIDLLVTHTPPIAMNVLYFSGVPRPPFYTKHIPWHAWPTEEGDVSGRYVQMVWEALNKPPLFCGHMHRSLVYETARILDINEVYLWKGE